MRRVSKVLKRWVFGEPIATDSVHKFALGSRLAIPIFGASLLSAVAYAPDAMLDALRIGSRQNALMGMAVGVVAIMLVLAFAYRSNVRVFPTERGDYGLVREQLGEKAGAWTGSALLVDYLLTVAVSVSAVTHLIAYLLPRARTWETSIGIVLILFMTLVNLRGIRDRIGILSIMWFGFLTVMIALFVTAVATGGSGEVAPWGQTDSASGSAWVAYLGAIASGAVMVTGIEHLAAAARFHKEPVGKRAGRTVVLAIIVSASVFLAVSWLAAREHVNGWVDGPVLLQVADRVFDNRALLIVTGVATVGVLYAASSAVFRRFSSLTSQLARDSFLPRQLFQLNDRLVHRGGVLIVAAGSALIVLLSQASIERLVHVYIVGVFASIVLSQIAMTRYMSTAIQKEKHGSERLRLQIRRGVHVLAAVVAGMVWLVVAIVNFASGAWAAVALMVGLSLLMFAIRGHYDRVRRDLVVTPHDRSSALPSDTHGIVLVAQLHRPALRAIAYAKAAKHSTLEAVAVQIDRDASQRLQKQWSETRMGIPLVVLASPYRSIVEPAMDYVRALRRERPRDVVVFYVPEYIVDHWWERLLHNRATIRLREQLLQEPGVVVTAVPWHLQSGRDRRELSSESLESIDV